MAEAKLQDELVLFDRCAETDTLESVSWDLTEDTLTVGKVGILRELSWLAGYANILGVEGLRAAMPGHTGDWYFTGDYPTPGGFKVLNTAFLNWRRGDERRAY